MFEPDLLCPSPHLVIIAVGEHAASITLAFQLERERVRDGFQLFESLLPFPDPLDAREWEGLDELRVVLDASASVDRFSRHRDAYLGILEEHQRILAQLKVPPLPGQEVFGLDSHPTLQEDHRALVCDGCHAR